MKWEAIALQSKGNTGKWAVNSLTDYICLCDAVEDSDKNEKNAHLIAAAPELLEACEFALRRLSDLTTAEVQLGKDFVLRSTLKKAIAKAT